MRIPEFTAEVALYPAGVSYRQQLGNLTRNTPGVGVVPAINVDIEIVRVGGLTFCCEPCMSGGPSGALVTFCCDPC